MKKKSDMAGNWKKILIYRLRRIKCDIDWDSEMEIGENDVNQSTEKFFSNMNILIDKHMH